MFARSSSRCSSTAASNNFWTAGPLALVNVFDAGRRRAVKEQALASYDHAAASYRESVLAAFREVEDQLSTLRVLTRRLRFRRTPSPRRSDR